MKTQKTPKKIRKGNSDRNLIESLGSGNKNLIKKKDMNINTVIDSVINVLRENKGNIAKEKLKRMVSDLNDSETFEKVMRSTKINYDPNTEMINIVSATKIKSLEDLKKEIRESKTGMMVDKELMDSYQGIEQDIERLKRENFVTVIKNEDNNCEVLFYRDMDDKYEKLIEENKDVINELRELWKKNDLINNIKQKDFTVSRQKRPREQTEQIEIFKTKSSGRKKRKTK